MIFKSEIYYQITGLIGGLLLLIIPSVFPDKFSITWGFVYFYQILIICGILSFFYFFSKILSIQFKFIIVLLLLFESIFYSCFLLMKLGIAPHSYIEDQLRDFYIHSMRTTPQFDEQLAQYDENLFYKLKPGDHQFSNLEFQNKFSINSQGVRDDNESLNFPEIICLGDSFTMGWGVEAEESFPSLIEKNTKQKTLNLGISSYGTVREYLLLKQTEFDSCKLLIIQYCSNDKYENRSYLNNTFNISSEEKYKIAQRINHLNSAYYPFKWSFSLFSKVIRLISFDRDKPIYVNKVEISDDVETFFKIINILPKKFSGKILIFNLEPYHTTDEYFHVFKQYLNKHPNNNIFLFNAASVLEKSDYFKIDDHLNTNGHRKIFKGILKVSKENNLLN